MSLSPTTVQESRLVLFRKEQFSFLKQKRLLKNRRKARSRKKAGEPLDNLLEIDYSRKSSSDNDFVKYLSL